MWVNFVTMCLTHGMHMITIHFPSSVHQLFSSLFLLFNLSNPSNPITLTFITPGITSKSIYLITYRSSFRRGLFVLNHKGFWLYLYFSSGTEKHNEKIKYTQFHAFSSLLFIFFYSLSTSLGLMFKTWRPFGNKDNLLNVNACRPAIDLCHTV